MSHTRSEIIRVRVTQLQKSLFAKCSAELKLPAATHAYELVLGAIQTKLETGAAARPETTCWPLAPGGAPPAPPREWSGCRGRGKPASRGAGAVLVRRQV